MKERADATERGGFIGKYGETLRGTFENPDGVSVCDLLSSWSHLYGLHC